MTNIGKPVPIRPGVSIIGDALRITSADRISETIARLDALGEGWRAPYFRAARDGLIALMIAGQGQRIDKRLLADRRRPQLLVLADDHPAATGPSGWPQARKLVRWSSGVLLHASGGEARWSSMAVYLTGQVGRLLMVECELRHRAAWMALAKAQGRRHLSILPTGGVHPIAGAPAGAVVQ
jgi:hypothetical protein